MLRCYFCRTAVADEMEAIELDWSPHFFDEAANEEIGHPICPHCYTTVCQWDEEFGDYVWPAVDASGRRRVG